MKQKIAFVGVGRMGANMARRVHEMGWPVTAVHDVNRAAADELATEIGAQSCTSLAEVTAAADVIFTVVTNDAAMQSIFAAQPSARRRTATSRRRQKPPEPAASKAAWPVRSLRPAKARSNS
jgi:3-hydroxyisobutyrate dehydrogenase-like beta-hydroxyacid dehydrogenase